MSRKRNRSGVSRLLAIPCVLLLGVLGVIGGSLQYAERTEAARLEREEQLLRNAELEQRAFQRAQRDAIFKLVRTHRPNSAESWCQRLTDAILDQSSAAGVDPLMIAAIVAQESSFHSRVTSRAGAVGLMQLRPFVAADVAQRGDLSWTGQSTLWDPDANVQLGVRYYKELMERFEGRHDVALTAYNEGPTRVGRQLRNGVYDGSDYARDILSLYDMLEGEVRRETRDT